MTVAAFLGTDVGGTFTDLVFYTEAGELNCLKVPSTPRQPGASILTGIDAINTALGLEAGAWRDLLHTHCSAVATNALIERRGARTGLAGLGRISRSFRICKDWR